MGLELDIRADFLAALRDRRYPQTAKRLRSEDDEFCALGVLCDIHPDLQWVRQGVRLPSVWSIVDKGAADGEAGTQATMGLPLSFMKRLGIDDDDEARIVHLNDEHTVFETDKNGVLVHAEHRTFPQIAQMIEDEGLLT